MSMPILIQNIPRSDEATIQSPAGITYHLSKRQLNIQWEDDGPNVRHPTRKIADADYLYIAGRPTKLYPYNTRALASTRRVCEDD